MRIDVYIHSVPSTSLEDKVDKILSQLGAMMAKVDELKAELVEINNTTNEIATDIDDLIAKLAGGLSSTEADEVAAELAALKTKLTGIAAVHTPTSPV